MFFRHKKNIFSQRINIKPHFQGLLKCADGNVTAYRNYRGQGA